MNLTKVNITIIGQGYVGLPLAIEFGKKYSTLGFDINSTRIDDLKKQNKPDNWWKSRKNINGY